jgi:hypothetical protein
VETLTVIFALLAAILYIAVFIWLGVTTFRRGHIVLFILGFFLPILWIVGALVPGPNDVRAAEPQGST